MPTIPLSRAETRSVAIPADPDAVFAFVADPRNLPRWAPGFASAVRPAGADWIVTSGGNELTIAVVSDPIRRTVDLLGGERRTTAVYSRVIANAEGSEYLFTILFPHGTPEAAVTAQMEVVDGELRTIRDLVAGADALGGIAA